MMQALGIKVTIVEAGDRLLDFLDTEIQEAFQYHLRQENMTLRLGEKVTAVELVEAPETARAATGKLVQAALASDKVLRAEALLYAVGRQASTATLRLDSVGVRTDARGRIRVNRHYQVLSDPDVAPPGDPELSGRPLGEPDSAHVDITPETPNLYAGGDVVGFPALASTAMEQGRQAACHMFGVPARSTPELFPFGIYAIPEMSIVGYTEQQLTRMEVPFESGKAFYREIARGELLGDHHGMLKLLVHQETRHILGVHILGSGATELIHIGQAVMALKGTVDYFVETVFNYPTLAECYKVAALNSVNRLQHV